VLGLFTLFGGVDLALPFLLDQMQIPSDMYQLYVVTGVLNSWFATLLAVMNLFAFTLVAACAATGVVKIKWSRILSFAIISLVIFAAVVVGTRFLLSEMVSKDDITRQTLMQAQIEDSKADKAEKTGSKEAVARKSPLVSIIKRGKLRVGYHPENLPFSFINDENELVGLDVELMHVLARELKVDLEFIEWNYETVFKDLDRGKFDIAIGGLIVNPERLAKANFSTPYINMTTAVVVEDHRRREFKSWRTIDKKLNARLGVVGGIRADNARRYLLNTEVVLLETYSDFFKDNSKGVDALVISAEAGSAWTILYPAYSVVVPEPHLKANAALAIPLAASDFEGFVNDWLELKRTGGIIDKLYNKWILGEEPEQKKGRWSIGRDLFNLWE
jgi:ABC-type amino acid transport substrate-binding protein